jgi:hypothetical protein
MIEYGKTIIMCFIHYSKALDFVDHSRLWNKLRNMGVSEHHIALIISLYANQVAAVRTEYGGTEWFEVRKGVRHGCILSPYLFNMYSEYIVGKVGFEDNIGFLIIIDNIGIKNRWENLKQFTICGRHHNISGRERRHGKTTKKAKRRERVFQTVAEP